MHGRASTRWLVVMLIGVGLGAAVLTVLYLVAQEQWREPVRAHERAAAAYVEAFCTTQSELATEPFFSRPLPPQPRDASAVLWARLGWGAPPVDGGVAASSVLVIPPPTRARLRADFMTELTEEDLAAVDSSFLAGLHEYDRWELTGAGGPLTGAATWTAITAPLPNLTALLEASKVHLKRAASHGTLVAAARDVRHAAWLAYSTESLLGAMVAMAMLDAERAAWSWAQAQQLPTEGWTPVPAATIDRARKALRAAPAFYSPMVAEQTFARAMTCDRVTRCAALTETLVFTGGLGEMLDEPWRSRVAAVRAATNAPQGGCSFALARYWATHPLTLRLPPGAEQPSALFRGDVAGLLMALNADTGALEGAFGTDGGR